MKRYVPDKRTVYVIVASIAVTLGVGLAVVGVVLSHSASDERAAQQAQLNAQRRDAIEQHQSLIDGCHRGNLLRAKLAAAQRNQIELNTYLAQLIQASIDRGEIPVSRLRRAYEARDHFTKLAKSIIPEKPVNCDKAYPAPGRNL